MNLTHMTKLSEFIESRNQEELNILKNNLETGNIHKLIINKLEKKQKLEENKMCPVCHNQIKEESLKLTFGPKGLRRQAHFCAIDCLEYFINKIKK